MNLNWPSWIGVVANDLDRQRRLYRDVPGFAEIVDGAGWVQFDLVTNGISGIDRSSGPRRAARSGRPGHQELVHLNDASALAP